jgi:hypothetical protein
MGLIMIIPTVVNKYKSTYTLYIGRGSKWGNPFVIGKDGTRADVVEKYELYARNNVEIMNSLSELSGQTLACFCKPLACHGDVLVKLFQEKFGC